MMAYAEFPSLDMLISTDVGRVIFIAPSLSSRPLNDFLQVDAM